MNTLEIEVIEESGSLIAIIISRQYMTHGLKIITPSVCPQQLARMSHPRGKHIDAPYSQDSKLRAVIHDRGIQRTFYIP